MPLIKKCFGSFLKLMIFFALFLLHGCPPNDQGSASFSNSYQDVSFVEDVEDDTYEADCHQKQFWFCPPLNAVWQMEVVVDICSTPPSVVSFGECVEYFECDPSIFLQGEQDCVTEKGYPGTQKLYCNKGRYEYGECLSPCFEEVCDGLDNDCDGEIDEGQTNNCGGCGFPPEEICNGIDDDCDGYVDEDLVEACSTPCDTGYRVCLGGTWSNCTAEEPEEEICNAIDDDCDGQVDEDLLCSCPAELVGVLIPCGESPLICGQGFKTCECLDPLCLTTGMTDCGAPCVYMPIEGEACDPYLGYPEEETCNNFDDDCDDLIDEDLYEECYTGPEGTLDVGICKGGTLTCHEGSWGSHTDQGFETNLCSGETLPQEEICNGADDDCDGITDYGEPMDPTDILLIVDLSGSMDTELAAVLSALQSFALYYTDEETLQWGLVLGPVVDSPGLFSSEALDLFLDLANFSAFLEALTEASETNWASSGNEMLMDALYITTFPLSNSAPYPLFSLVWEDGIKSYPEISNFPPNWRDDSEKVVIIFTDEKAQSFLDPELSAQDVEASISTCSELKVYTFTNPISRTDWELLSNTTGGNWFELSIDAEKILNDLLQILDENVCK